ncbi:unnamed protein product [Effrenium voratum]|nr:unnamed protein product [Effrenium voratum]
MIARVTGAHTAHAWRRSVAHRLAFAKHAKRGITGLAAELAHLRADGPRKSLWLLVPEPGAPGPHARSTAEEVRTLAAGARATVVDFAGKGAANFEVLLERLQDALITAAVEAESGASGISMEPVAIQKSRQFWRRQRLKVQADGAKVSASHLLREE